MDLLREWLTNNEIFQTVHQTVVSVLQRCPSVGFGGTLRAEIMSSDMGEPYPETAMDTLRQAIQQYDEINEHNLINSLQRSIAVTQDDAGVGIRLAREVTATIRRIREKDALGTRVVLLASLLQIYHKNLGERHEAWVATAEPADPNVSRILSSAVKRLQNPDDINAFWESLTPSDYEMLARFLRVPDTEVRQTLQNYIDRVMETLFVNPPNK